MKKGTVKWYNATKGFGFISCEDGSEDVFVHSSLLAMKGDKVLKEGQTVAFEIVDGPKGPQAVNVTVV